MAAAKKEKETIAIKPIKKKRIPIRIVGDSPIIIHAWSEKAKKEMLDMLTEIGSAIHCAPPFEIIIFCSGSILFVTY